MSTVKHLIALFLIGAFGSILARDYNSNVNTNINNHYPSHVKVDHSGTVIERKATKEENDLAAARAARDIENMSKPFMQQLGEPIYANVSYCLNASPFGVSNGSILGVAGAILAARYLYGWYNNSVENSESQEPKK